ncbi:MAG: Bax protein [Halieaceae bacterium]|jgi:Bax protein
MKGTRYGVLVTATFGVLILGGCIARLGELPDFASIKDAARMKQTFYDYLLPAVAQENARILEQRRELTVIRSRLAAGERPGWFQRRKLKALAEEYEVDWNRDELALIADRLWGRVDVIPEELTLVQAVKESGWGRSRFAVEGNNLFGQWCYEPGCGVVPKQRSAGATHEVEAFDSVSESIRRYMNNLNTHERYATLRRLRADRRRKDHALTGAALAPGLLGYSERGGPYVDEILSMMRQNRELLGDAAAT